MSTLTETAENTKKYGCIFLLLLGGWITIRTGWKIYKAVINPPKPVIIYGQFGKLPVLPLVGLKLESGSTPTYSLETTAGTLPAGLPVALPVYKTKTQAWTFMSEKRARDLASKIGFTGLNEKTSSPTLFYWKDAETGAELRVNTVTGKLTIETPLAVIEDKVKPGQAPTAEAAKGQALGFLRQQWEVPKDYNDGTQTTILAKAENGQLNQAETPYEAELVRVDLFRQITLGEEKKKSYPILGPNPRQGLISLLVAGTNFKIGGSIPRVTYTYWVMDTTAPGLYPLKPVANAYQELRDGKGYITYLNLKKHNPFAAYTPLRLARILIRDVKLAYFDSESQPKFLQPIYVFEGAAFTTNSEEAEYVAYVPAVSPEYAER